MIDTHSHIDFEEYQNNFEHFLKELQENEIEKVIIPGVEPQTFTRILNICEKNKILYCALGVHPSEYQSYTEDTEKEIIELSKNKKVIAIGEIGLDYHYGADSKEEQKDILHKQLKLAEKLQLPVLIHDREAHDDCLNIVKQYNLKDVVFHCFSGNLEFAEKCITEGYYIAIGGVVTFKNAKDLKEVAKEIPLNKILLETDAPYLAPTPFRGKLNTPAYLKYIATEIANLKGISIEEIKEITTQNAKRIFNF